MIKMIKIGCGMERGRRWLWAYGICHIQGNGEGMDPRKMSERRGEQGLWSIIEDKYVVTVF